MNKNCPNCNQYGSEIESPETSRIKCENLLCRVWSYVPERNES